MDAMTNLLWLPPGVPVTAGEDQAATNKTDCTAGIHVTSLKQYKWVTVIAIDVDVNVTIGVKGTVAGTPNAGSDRVFLGTSKVFKLPSNVLPDVKIKGAGYAAILFHL